MKQICVFCGSSMGYNSRYREAAEQLGRLLAESRIGLVYGGAGVGLMKALADSVMQHGGQVTGVMPVALVEKEVAHPGIPTLHIVADMAERKSMMVSLSDGFIAMPGGFGTLDELSEILTFNQLRINESPLGLLNTGGYFEHLLRFFNHGVAEGFIRGEHRDNLLVSDDSADLITKMKSWKPVPMGKWIEEIRLESKA
ncbi:MAG: TIGR00730 family Rossman fold protein [Bacteroidetes bacterium]|nr:TIGR00730 family Rossman fold protein [Bacteroidota bacterium]